MRLSFDSDQLLFRDAVRDFLQRECTAADVRMAWADPAGCSLKRWRGLAEMGVAGLLVDERYDGLGLDEVGFVLVLEEAGRAASPDPVVETAAVGAPLLAEVAPAGVAQAWLPKVAAGDALLAVGLWSSPYVAAAHLADLLLLQHEAQVHAVPRAQVQLEAQPSVDGARRLWSVAWQPSGDTLLTDNGRPAIERAFDRGALATAAQLLGIGEHLIEVTAGYARDRRQFGVPIGSFQAVKHHLADALVALELARPVVYRAAWSVAHDAPTRSVDVSMAKAYASDAADLAARTALQVHGAIGYTWEHDLHLWMKKAWALAAAWGDADWHRERVASAVIDQPPNRRNPGNA